MPGYKYFGFDIHLWSSFEKHENTKAALLSAVGSKASSSSSFRIIAGGMFGTPLWQQDEKLRGPQQDELCNVYKPFGNDDREVDEVKAVTGDDTKHSSIDAVLEESIKSLQGKDQKIALLCGKNCPVSIKLENIDSVQQVITLHCPTMTNFNEFGKQASDNLATCEKHLAKTLEDVAENGQLDSLVIDSTADKVTASILLKILTSKKKLAKTLFNPEVKVLSAYNEEDDKWHMHLLRLFRDEVFSGEKFGFYSEVLFKNENGSFKLLITSIREEHFIKKLEENLGNFEKASGMTPIIQNIYGGIWHYQPDFVPSKSYTPDDYDQTSSLEQWNSQVPLGHQVVFQMEPEESEKDNLVLSNDLVRAALELSILQSSLPLFEENDLKMIEEYNEAGDGHLLVSLWSGGSIVLLWNGKDHVDINISVYKSDEAFESIKAFEENFTNVISELKTILRDEQPRGVGRVVSYWNDIEESVDPHWT